MRLGVWCVCSCVRCSACSTISMHFRICCNSLTSLRFVFSSSYSPVDWAFSSSNSFCHSDTLKDFVPSGRFACRKRLAAFQIMRSLSWACSNFLSFAPSVFQRFQFIVNGLQAVVVAAMLDKLSNVLMRFCLATTLVFSRFASSSTEERAASKSSRVAMPLLCR